MFGKNADSASADRHAHSVLQEGMAIVGTVDAKGDVRFDGKLEGKLTATERVTIGSSGVLAASVEANEVIIMGVVEGSVRARRRLELKKGARVIGDVSAPVLVIEEGVFFHGNSNMKPEAEPAAFLGTVEGGAQQRKEEDGSHQQLYQ
jgi:cytoskeletal protein CcmA (bactofilin family)